jgi:hypothetical protein
MGIYHANEFQFHLPDALKDKTVHIFSLTDDGPSEFSLIVARDALRTGEDLGSYVLRQRELFGRNLPGFQHLADAEVTLDGRGAIQSDHTWRTPDGKMYQRQIAVISPQSPAESPQALVITATCKDRISEKWEAVLAETLATLRFRT